MLGFFHLLGQCADCNIPAFVNLKGRGFGEHMEIVACSHVTALLLKQAPDYTFSWKQIGLNVSPDQLDSDVA